jgi:hypothetical protein
MATEAAALLVQMEARLAEAEARRAQADAARAPKVKVRPSNPIMGTTEETYPGSDNFYYAFGGEPLSDWTGIKDPDSRLISDMCCRPTDRVSGQKGTIARQKGLDTKYSQSVKLSDFQKKIWTHLKDYGLDTIAYLPDPQADPSSKEVLSVITHHARFTGNMEKSMTASQSIKKKYDSWDLRHDNEASKFLMNSLDDTIKEGFEAFQDEGDSFTATWLKLIHYLITTSAKTYDALKDQIRKKRPQQYSGQNISKLSQDYLALAKELENAGHFDSSLVLSMVDGFLGAQKDTTGTFHHEMNTLRVKVDNLVTETVFMTKDEQKKAFTKERVTYSDVNMRAVKVYRDLVHHNRWEPAKLPRDQQSPASNLVNLATMTKAQIMMIVNNMKGSNDPKSVERDANGGKKFQGKCYNCGEMGHMANDCHKPKRNKGERKTNHESRNDNGIRKNRRHQGMARWKLEKPKSGEKEEKTVEGKKYYWCAKCNNWTPTHNTSQHTGGRTSLQGDANAHLTALDPTIWCIQAEPKLDTHQSWISVFLQGYFLLTMILLFSSGKVTPASILDFISWRHSATHHHRLTGCT